MSGEPAGTLRLAAIVLRSRDPATLATFYRDAFDFVDGPPSGGTTRLALGDTHLWIESIEPAAATPAAKQTDVPGWSPRFQHFAMRVADMDAAMARLDVIDGWRPITTGGPERLPANTGGVTAFKFYDPEGHPLEFLMFPDRRDGALFAEIDHTAISVVDVERSVAFYAALGLAVAARSLNTGIEQERLDAIDGATVDVVALRTPSGRSPHVELLGYRGAFARAPTGPMPDEVLATRMVFSHERVEPASTDRATRLACDPDGHSLEVR